MAKAQPNSRGGKPSLARLEIWLKEAYPSLVAKMFGISPTHLRELVKDGYITQGGKAFDLFIAVPEWGKYKQSHPRNGAVVDYRKGIDEERHRKLKLANRITQSEIIPAADYYAVLNVTAAVVTQQLEGLPGRLANVLAGETEPAVVRKVLQDEARRIRETISQTSEHMARTRTLFADNETTTGEDAGSVG